VVDAGVPPIALVDWEDENAMPLTAGSRYAAGDRGGAGCPRGTGSSLLHTGLFGQNVVEVVAGFSSSPAAESELIQVAIVDDHPVARRGLQSILTEAGDIQVSAAVATPAELSLAGPGAVQPDVIMLDLYHDGDEPCLDVIPQLRRDYKVLVVSASGRPADVLGAIRVGACGYVTKLADPSMLVAAVRTVAGGASRCPPNWRTSCRGSWPGSRPPTAPRWAPRCCPHGRKRPSI
jgi:DNA-binding NarL/FixJ family response regulator